MGKRVVFGYVILDKGQHSMQGGIALRNSMAEDIAGPLGAYFREKEKILFAFIFGLPNILQVC